MKVGIIGTGSMGLNHLRVVNSLDGLDLTAGVDTDLDALKEVRAKYQIKTVNDYKKIVDSIDMVMVSTPTEYHYEISKFFLESKKHVLVEKPITNDQCSAEELIKIAERSGVMLAVGHLERYNPAIIYADSVVKEPKFIEIQRLGSFSNRSMDIDVIMDLMIHDLDIIGHWDRSKILDIRACGIPVISKKIDICNARIEFASGLVANVTASRVSREKTRKLRVFQKNSYLSLDYQKRRVKEYKLNGMDIIENIPGIENVEPLVNLWKNFYSSIKRNKAELNVTGEDGLLALKLAKSVAKATEK
jgi:predicted dehydrogenase